MADFVDIRSCLARARESIGEVCGPAHAALKALADAVEMLAVPTTLLTAPVLDYTTTVIQGGTEHGRLAELHAGP